jgi:Heterokaryon incompatibility protein (HET)
LQQAAMAAKYLECDYIWLDLLCIEQLESADKAIQICNMSRIYKSAAAVLVMFGGCRAAQGLEYHSLWIERAWTLQEATVNKETWALVGLTAFPRKQTQRRFTISSVNSTILKIGNQIGLVKLRELLNVDINQPLGAIIHPARHNDPYICSAQMKCLGSNPRAIETLKIIVDHIKSDSDDDKVLVMSAEWSSIWMRTSTEPQDMVFSIMHLFGVKLEVNYGQTVEELYLELARQTSQTPVWLTIAPYAELVGGLIPRPASNFRRNSLQADAISQLVHIDDMTAWIDIVVNSTSSYLFRTMWLNV